MRATAWRAVKWLGVLAGVGLLVGGSAAALGETADRAATDAYLVAIYSYEQGLVVNASASTAAVEARAAAIGAECPGVLAGVPGVSSSEERARDFFEGGSVFGQLRKLVSEMDLALFQAQRESDRQAILALAHTVGSLQWRNRTVTQAARAFASRLEMTTRLPAPSVCADMRAWVTSGYKTLSAATQALLAEVRQTEPLGLAQFGQLLVRYEGARERALILKTRKLERTLLGALTAREALHERLSRTLGVPASLFEPPPEHAAGSRVIGRGRTAAGERYVVWLEPPRSGTGGREHCALPISIRGIVVGENLCLTRSEPPLAPSVNCQSGRLTIEAYTSPAARRVRLKLSDGRHITSPVILVPPRLGGPATYYVQVVRGPSPIPVSLTQLDARGRALRAHDLPRIVECTERPVKYFPGGIRTLVRGRVPQGPKFQIIGEHFRFLGKDTFSLKVEVEGGGSGGGSGGKSPSLFSWTAQTGCRPHPYAIVNGLLTRARDTVFARWSGALHALTKVAIPANLHAGGVLVYGALPELPSEIIVKAPGGKPDLTERLGNINQELHSCQGREGEEGGTGTVFGA